MLNGPFLQYFALIHAIHSTYPAQFLEWPESYGVQPFIEKPGSDCITGNITIIPITVVPPPPTVTVDPEDPLGWNYAFRHDNHDISWDDIKFLPENPLLPRESVSECTPPPVPASTYALVFDGPWKIVARTKVVLRGGGSRAGPTPAAQPGPGPQPGKDPEHVPSPQPQPVSGNASGGSPESPGTILSKEGQGSGSITNSPSSHIVDIPGQTQNPNKPGQTQGPNKPGQTQGPNEPGPTQGSDEPGSAKGLNEPGSTEGPNEPGRTLPVSAVTVSLAKRHIASGILTVAIALGLGYLAVDSCMA